MSAKRVFISYNHDDSHVAEKIKSALEAKGHTITIDTGSMQAGAPIQGFIEQSVREANVTLSIVSNRSLLSAWVAMESLMTFYSERLQDNKKIIACYLDDDIFKSDYRIYRNYHRRPQNICRARFLSSILSIKNTAKTHIYRENERESIEDDQIRKAHQPSDLMARL